ncbi:MAG: TVP38/TMEM64 family protein [Chthoniobacteraceae bacterium]
MSQFVQQILAQLLQWQVMLQSYGWLGVALFAIGVACVQMALIPLSIFAVAAGVIFGVEKAFVGVTIGTNLGAVINFLVARYGARGLVSRYLSHHEKFRLIDAAIGREGGKIVALLRLCPLPFGLANYCYGLTAVRFWPYFIATFVMIIPANLFFVWLGASAHESFTAFSGKSRPRHPGEYVLMGVGLVAAFCALSYITRLAKAALAKGERAPSGAPLENSKAG